LTEFWHSFADMAAVQARGELVIERGEGIYIFDASGRRYIDATASLWYCFVGHGRGAIADAVAAQMRELEAYSTFQDLTNAPASELAARVASLAPVLGSKVFLTSGGSDSIETAAKMSRRYHNLRGEPDRRILITRENAYHGMHLAGTSLAGIEMNRAGYGPFADEVVRVPWDSAEALADAIDGTGPEKVAAFFCEPVIGAGGVFAPPEGYLRAVSDICRERGVLFVADEVITGFGRVGKWFACSRWGIEPDLITCAKGITSGYLPVGAVIAAPWVAEPFWAEGAGMWRHGYTYSGHASAAAAALVNLDIMEEEGLIDRALELEVELAAALHPLEEHSLVSEVRAGTGVMAAVQIDEHAIADDPDLPMRAVAACRESGVMTRTLATGAIHVSPPLVIDGVGLKELGDGLSAALDLLESGG
jgi:adenosylmethionine-8-amino-7-oxononanoate aminotransferase